MDETQALRRAREAIKQGDKATGQRLLLQVIKANPHNEVAWLWLSAIIDDPAKERDCLERVLAINPDNEVAQMHLTRLRQADLAQTQPTMTQPEKEPATLASPLLPQPKRDPQPSDDSSWRLPNIQTILEDRRQIISQVQIQNQTQIIEMTLESFGSPARVVEVGQGPATTQFSVEPGFISGHRAEQPRVRVSKIRSLADDLALALAAFPIHIQAPIPGSSMIGIQVPNKRVASVSLREVMETEAFERRSSLFSWERQKQANEGTQAS
jgi:DNA segregation ATPase FtsK/SpoIIIE-like protein